MFRRPWRAFRRRFRPARTWTRSSPLVGFSPRKANLVLYLVGGLEDRYSKLLDRLGPHKAGSGCLYLKRLDAVDLDVLRELVARTVRVHRGADRGVGAA